MSMEKIAEALIVNIAFPVLFQTSLTILLHPFLEDKMLYCTASFITISLNS